MTAPARTGPLPSGGGPAPSPDLDDLVADLGDRIRAERLHRGWSQAHLGTRAGLPKKYVGLAEAGHAALPVVRLAQLCHGLGMPMSDLLSDRWVMPERKTPRVLTPRQVQILAEARTGAPLSVIAVRVGMPRESVGSRMSEVYRQLDVAHLPYGRREAAIRVAVELGLLEPAALDDAA
ncbi:helix-turn-helix transcriptional regulator [Streptomyces sp. ME02-6979.5a]|uniref:helix-turn-helix transcriptional regulator n=1 Tax=Streptomyces sp. ME02-6979.5a TaxID=462925 RepID=UPI0029AB454D|nr:helix-turn-helix transcriptional regulator [Streptomyces sp. ME02-6979.5a]MDX3343444.1 helix-turn-helix transcriptional regulator [Streptomyces sp. ME02-6979.5a]